MLLLSIFFMLCMLYYVFLILRAAWYFSIEEKKECKQTAESISVIVPARNEAKNIITCLESIFAQDFEGEWEVILVNDHSTDDTARFAREFSSDQAHFSLLELSDTSGKKAAITAGIEAAKYDIILQTDADCIVPHKWLQAMSDGFSPKTEMLSGPVLLSHGSSYFEQLQSLEYFGLVVLGAGSLLSGHPNMANGANIAYRKSTFEAVGGFAGIDHVASGDDELLLQKVSERGIDIINFAKSRDAIVVSPAQPRWAQFKAQRLRWVSKARGYRNRWVNMSQVISWLAFFGMAFCSLAAIWIVNLWPWALCMWGLKIAADFWLMSLAARFFQQPKLMRLFLLLQIVYVPYVIWIGVAGNLVSTYLWKGRRVK